MNDLIDLWKKHLSPFLSDPWESVFFWRTLALALMTIFLIGLLFRNRVVAWILKGERVEHDRQIFVKADGILTERHLLDLVASLMSLHACIAGSMHPLDRLPRFFQEEGNQYLKKRLRKASSKLVSACNALSHFVSLNFWVHPPNQGARDFEDTWIRLHPELNIDTSDDPSPRKEDSYAQYAKQLDELCIGVTKEYRSYRALIKDALRL